jgi:hypothetical protein
MNENVFTYNDTYVLATVSLLASVLTTMIYLLTLSNMLYLKKVLLLRVPNTLYFFYI